MVFLPRPAAPEIRRKGSVGANTCLGETDIDVGQHGGEPLSSATRMFMEPRFRAGERVILDRIKPASIDTDVIVQLRDDDERSLWTIGKLSARDRNLIGLTQYKDRLTASIHRSKVRHIFPIIAMLDDEA